MTSENQLPPSYDDTIRHVGASGYESDTPPAQQSNSIRPMATSGQAPASIQPEAMIQQPTNQPILYMVQQPTNQPAYMVQQPTNQPAYMVQQPTIQPTYMVQQPANQPTYMVQQPTNQPTYMVQQSTNEPILYMVQYPTNELTTTIHQPTYHPTTTIHQPRNQHAHMVQHQQPTTQPPLYMTHPTSRPTNTIQQPPMVNHDHNYIEPSVIPRPTHRPQTTTTPDVRHVMQQQQQTVPQNVINIKKRLKIASILTTITFVILIIGLLADRWTVSKIAYARRYQDEYDSHGGLWWNGGLFTDEGVVMTFALTFYLIGAILMFIVAFERVVKKRRIIIATLIAYCSALVLMLAAVGTFASYVAWGRRDKSHRGLYEIMKTPSTLSWSFGVTIAAMCGILATIILNGITCYKYPGLRDGQGVTSTPAGTRRDTLPGPAGARRDTLPGPAGARRDTLPGPAGARRDMLRSSAGARRDTLSSPAGSAVVMSSQVEGPGVTASPMEASRSQRSSSNTSRSVNTATTNI